MRGISIHRRTKAIIALSLLSPVLGELVSGSSPLLEFINPVSFLFLWAFYGSGVLLAREIWVRWGRNYLRLMLLGMVYGIFEEGLMIKSWFDPNWMDLDVFGRYGRIWGINAVWAVWLTIFHSLMSISAPIIIFSAFFQEYAEKPLLNGKEMKIVAVILFIAAAITYFGLNPYSPPPVQYVLAVLLAVLMLWAAKSIRIQALTGPKTAVKKYPAIYGFTAGLLFSFIFTAFPHSTVSPLVPALLGVLLTAHFYSNLYYLDEGGRYSQISGFVAFWALIWSVILEINGVFGAVLVGIFMFLVLYLGKIIVNGNKIN